VSLNSPIQFDWIVGLGRSNNIYVVYIDFSKAFDSIVFSKLIFKLKNCGITGNLLAWLSSFIYGRSQCVVLENCFSSISDVISGNHRAQFWVQSYFLFL